MTKRTPREAAERVIASYREVCQMTTPHTPFEPEKSSTESVILAVEYMREHPADDDESVTAEWLESLGYSDSMNSLDTKRYEIVDGIRVMMLFPCEGPRCWRADLWVGSGRCYVTPDVRRRQVRQLLAALGIGVKS